MRVISKVLELDGAGWGRGRRRFASPRGFVFPEGGSEGGRPSSFPPSSVGKARQGSIPASLPCLPSHGSNRNRRDLGLREGRGKRVRLLFSLNLPTKLQKKSRVVNHHPSLQSSSYLKWKKEKRHREREKAGDYHPPALAQIPGNQPLRCV